MLARQNPHRPDKETQDNSTHARNRRRNGKREDSNTFSQQN